MGQYWYTVNLDKEEFINPYNIGCGLKLLEQIGVDHGTGSALVILLASSPGRGLGDIRGHNDVVGRWAGDRIALIGDYAEDEDLPNHFKASTIYDKCKSGEYTDISEHVAKVIEEVLDGEFVGEGWKDFVYHETL